MMPGVSLPLDQSRDRLATVLRQRQVRIVLAESCTAGLCAAVMGQVDGISNYLCGSAVTYRAAQKQAWLGVRGQTIQRHTTESLEVAQEMALGVLARTPEAAWAAAVVGDLADGTRQRVYIALARRSAAGAELQACCEEALSGATRVLRQREAASRVLDQLAQAIERS